MKLKQIKTVSQAIMRTPRTIHPPLEIIFVSYNKTGAIYNACLILQDGKLRKIKLVTALKKKVHNSKDSKRASSQLIDRYTPLPSRGIPGLAVYQSTRLHSRTGSET
jgi:hypothetical protein